MPSDAVKARAPQRDATYASGSTMRRILVISPTPTHPTNAGNRVRIRNFCEQLRRWSYDVHFLHVRMYGGDHDAMRASWGDRYCWAAYEKPLRRETFIGKWARRARQAISIDARYLVGVDEWYDPAVDFVVRDLAHSYRFDAVVVNYVFLSRALLLFGDDVLKLLDTINLFTNRHRMLLS